MKKVVFMMLAAVVLVVIVSLSTSGSGSSSVSSFSGYDWHTAGTIAVQSGGRVKPLDTFARELVAQIYGKSSYEGEPPVQTYFRWMADGEHWAHEPLIYLPKSELRTRMGLESHKGSRFSLDELQNNRGLMEIGQEGQRKDAAGEKLSFTESKASDLFNRMHILNAVFTHETPFYVPSDPRDPMATWLSMPSAMNALDSTALAEMEDDESASDTLQVLALSFTGMYHSIADGRGDVFNTAAEVFVDAQHSMLNNQPETLSGLSWEVRYNRFQPFYWAKILLGAAFLIYALSWRKGWETLRSYGFAGLVFGLLSYTCGMAMRAYISGRAPWSNMYESLLAIGWAMLLISVIWMLFRHEKAIGMVASLLGVFILGIAQFASLDRGINPLVPALQSYWLNYHVIIVLSSYSCFAIAMGIGHAVLITAVRTKGEMTPTLLSLTKTNLKVVQVGSLLLIAGILLGAVWANVSWGRFWGWDPKETWALICWFVYIVLLHGRSAGWLGWRGLAAYSVGVFPIVIMTYYGVNYYLSGLHSYGAGSSPGIPWQVFAYVGLEALFLFWALSKLRGTVPTRPKKPRPARETKMQTSEVS